MGAAARLALVVAEPTHGKRLCRDCDRPGLGVPQLCRGVVGFGAGKRRKCLIFNTANIADSASRPCADIRPVRGTRAKCIQEISKQSLSTITAGEEKMIKTIILSMCLAASSLSLNALAQDERQYTDGPVTEVDYIRVEYGYFEKYIDWLNSTWKPTMEAMKKAGLIIDYKVVRATPKSPDQPNIFLMITFKNAAAALDKGVELEEVAKKVIGSTEVQNKARVGRNEYRKLLGIEYIREIVLK